jgi:hypothetical protein
VAAKFYEGEHVKFYNPFKPHIVKFKNGKYGVRALDLLGWAFLDVEEDEDFWWRDEDYVVEHAQLNSLKQAQSRLEIFYSGIYDVSDKGVRIEFPGE